MMAANGVTTNTPDAAFHVLLSKAVMRVARDTPALRTHRPPSCLPRPTALRVSKEPAPPSLKSGYRRRGALPRLHQILDQIALMQPLAHPIAFNDVCNECGCACDAVACARRCACGAVAHGQCVSTFPWYCQRWRCQVRQRADRVGLRLSTRPPACTEHRSELLPTPAPSSEHPLAPTPAEYPGTKAWRIINSFFDTVHDVSPLTPSSPPAGDLYHVPVPELNYRDIWDNEDRCESNDATPRSARYKQRIDAAATPPPTTDFGATSGCVSRASFYVRFEGDGETPVLRRRHGAFRSLDLQYAVASALIQPGECLSSDLQYMFPPPLYDPLTARFFLSGTPAPGDSRPRPPNSSLHFYIERIASDDDPLQDAEDDGEICCELWLLRRHLEAQIKENNAKKEWLRQAVTNDLSNPRSDDGAARACRQRILDAYVNHTQTLTPTSSTTTVASAVMVETPPPLAMPDITDIDRALTIASEPHACPGIALDDLCGPIADKRVVMARPPTLATILDFKSTDMVLDDYLNRLAVHEVVRNLVDSVAASLSAPPYALQDHLQWCICQTPADMSRWYISCDVCENWFHGVCAGLADATAEFIDQFVCASCVRRSRRRTALKQGYLQRFFLGTECSWSKQDRIDAVDVVSTLRIRIRRREEITGIFVHDGLRVVIDDPVQLLHLLSLPPPLFGEVQQHHEPLRRSQREAAQWAIALNRIRDVDVSVPLSSFTKKRQRSFSRIMSRTADGVTLSVHGKRLGRPPKKLLLQRAEEESQQLQEQVQKHELDPEPDSWPPSSDSSIIVSKRQPRLKRARCDSMC